MTDDKIEIVEFLLERIQEEGNFVDNYWPGQSKARQLFQHNLAIMTEVVQFHKNWPVLMEAEPNFTVYTDYDTYRTEMIQHMAWVTQEEYVKVFGRQPPTAPLLAKMAAAYSDHPHYKAEWAS